MNRHEFADKLNTRLSFVVAEQLWNAPETEKRVLFLQEKAEEEYGDDFENVFSLYLLDDWVKDNVYDVSYVTYEDKSFKAVMVMLDNKEENIWLSTLTGKIEFWDGEYISDTYFLEEDIIDALNEYYREVYDSI